jgi:prophage maintenance system killer protein
MSSKKEAVVRALKTKKVPVTLSELLQTLGSDFAERSTRRWLNEMVQEGLIKKTGQRRGTHYQLISLAKNFFTAYPFQSIDYIQLPYMQRKPVAYHREWLEEYQPNNTFYLPAHDRAQMHAQGQRERDSNQAGTYARKIYNRLLIDLSYNSSRLEGNTYSLLETQRLVLEGRSAKGKLDAEKIMILNHKEAIRHLVESAPKIGVDFNEICTLHFLLSDALIPAQDSGHIRNHGVRISRSTYVPLENKAQLEQQLQRICQKARQIEDPYESSFFLLTHLAYLQAFADVNKRTSRLSANIPLIQHNRVPLSFNDVEKEDYLLAMLAIYELNDVAPLAKLYYFSYLRSCESYNVHAEAMGYDEVRARYRPLRRETIRHIIIKQLLGENLHQYIYTQAQAVPVDQQERFIQTITEDLQQINPARIAGMGITLQQLTDWLALRKIE